jgi:phosphopantetheinyl transferase
VVSLCCAVSCCDQLASPVHLLTDSGQERQRISRFKFRKDAKLALVGRLLLQHTACSALGQSFGMADFVRTEERKPILSHTTPHGKGYCCCCSPGGGKAAAEGSGRNGEKGAREQEPAGKERASQFCQFNLNLSHHGAWVFLASAPSELVGADVMTITPPRPGECPETFFRDFEGCLTRNEWDAVRSCQHHGHSALFRAFFVFWTLKESYIKAVGIGLGLDLMRIEFEVPTRILLGEGWSGKGGRTKADVEGSVDAALYVDAVKMSLDSTLRPDWTFEVGHIDSEHIIAVARGPLEDAVPSFRDALGRCRRESEEGSESLASVDLGGCALCEQEQQVEATRCGAGSLAVQSEEGLTEMLQGSAGRCVGKQGQLDPGELRVDPDLSEVGDSVGVLKVHVLTVEELLSTSDGLVQEYRRLE